MISPDWTPQERIDLMAKILAELFSEGHLSAGVYRADRMERLSFLATASPGFLEANRGVIIHGQADETERAAARAEIATRKAE